MEACETIGAECDCKELCPECKKYLEEKAKNILANVHQYAEGNETHLGYLAGLLIDELVLLL